MHKILNKKFLLAAPFPIALAAGQGVGLLSDWSPETYSMSLCGIFLIYIAVLSKSRILIASSIFCSSYFLLLLPYFYYGIGYASRQEYQEASMEAVNVLYITFFTIVFFSVWFIRGGDILGFPDRIKKRDNPIIFWACAIIILLFSGMTVDPRGTIFTANYRDITSERYGFIDYSLIFAMMAFIFGGGKKREKVLIFVCAIYIAINLLYGLRLRSIQMMLLMFILFFERKISPKQTLWISILGLLGSQIFGQLRAAIEIDSLAAAFGGVNGIMVTNQGGVFLTANMYIGLIQDGLISSNQRITTFVGNIIAIVYSQNSLPDDYNIARLAANHFSIPGGGLISGYMYAWGGVLGLVAGTLCITVIYLRAYSRKCSEYFLVYGVLIMSIIPRWFAYSPLHLFKMGVWCVFVFAFLKVLDKSLREV